ncbi:transcription factor 25 isoform X2 [Olea europaea var. sylvestris]|uniref:transcription factor 25 isoform X2 n=1 Tax=Olea europaea var. sylvestris TaxID=158386 RepID=UPI000C1D7586|nr:transcription factor 25 isoform X2 [Olea europaea var. sylvestris]
MSARLLKKVLKEQEAALRQQEEELYNGHESESPDSSTPPKNPFDLLDDNNDDYDVVDPDSDQEKDNSTNESSMGNIDGKHPSMLKATINNVSTSDVKTKKKKKKNKKKKIKDDLSASAEDDEISSGLMLENLSLGASSYGDKSAKVNNDDIRAKHCKSSILQIDPKFLRPENELRRIFGSKVVNSFERSHHSGSSSSAHVGRRGSHNHRRTILVSPSERWPRWDGSLSMELMETKDEVHYFRYVHSSSYGQAQRAFEAAKAIHDLNGIASILLYHPYHIDSLITLADYFKFLGEHERSADAIAKCLYALECAWHPMFSPLLGNFQLKYVYETNKPLFSALFTHMKNMDRRGCHRSALEVCKLLLSLDLDDPMGAIFCIDYYSLRAEEYSWLERFSEEYKGGNSLWLFPNFSISLAVCRFYIQSHEGLKERKMDTGKAAASDLMKQALMLHPSVLKKLVAKVPLKDPAWSTILKHSFFRPGHTGIPSLDHLINIYVERSYILWRLPDLQKFLRDSALMVIETLKDNGREALDWACVRKEAFSSEKNEYSHLLVSDFSDSMPTMPPDNLQNFMVDPRGGLQNREELPNPPDLTNRNVLSVLLESVLPWTNYGRGDGDGFQHDHPDQADEI